MPTILMPKTSTNKYTSAIGRRRASIASIKLFSGKGDNLVNTRAISKYFPGQVFEIIYQKPFKVTDTLGKYYFTAKVSGGGLKGQSEAVSLAVSRALVKLNTETFKPLLRVANLLSVDARVRQRRMVGTGGKARRQKQSPKR